MLAVLNCSVRSWTVHVDASNDSQLPKCDRSCAYGSALERSGLCRLGRPAKGTPETGPLVVLVEMEIHVGVSQAQSALAVGCMHGLRNPTHMPAAAERASIIDASVGSQAPRFWRFCSIDPDPRLQQQTKASGPRLWHPGSWVCRSSSACMAAKIESDHNVPDPSARHEQTTHPCQPPLRSLQHLEPFHPFLLPLL